jgi:hypothetical protein
LPERRATPATDSRTPFERFQDLARRILTTPKAELVKPADVKRVLASKPGRKKKGK